jgi:hypothetical protein
VEEDGPSLCDVTALVSAAVDIDKVKLVNVREEKKMLGLLVKIHELLLSELMEFKLF